MDEALSDDQDRLIHGEIMPLARAQPGFRSGYWMRDRETGKGHITMIFDSYESASRFRTLVESRTQRAAQAGVTSDILSTVEVVAEASASPVLLLTRAIAWQSD
jgi:heme-degrading monooxygenase HmoA